ncbi:hypothetical protein HN803_02955 [candidate division WWE3 bacterium]|jgi:hypothetical protein|nr:hypothetical protein [candidate division WWE3 bacterium]
MSWFNTLMGDGVGTAAQGIGELAIDIRTAITGQVPPEKEAEIEFALMKAQAEINRAEAKHRNIFVAGWRPFIGWVCGGALAYNFIIYPILQVYTIKPLPALQTDTLLELTLAMLGMATLRTIEKSRGLTK